MFVKVYGVIVQRSAGKLCCW